LECRISRFRNSRRAIFGGFLRFLQPDGARLVVYELPINTPVANTSAPPRPTCKAAETVGVSM